MSLCNHGFIIEKVCETSQAQLDAWEMNKSASPENCSVLSLQFSLGSLNMNSFQISLEQLVERHDSLRTKFQYIDNSLKQVVCRYDRSMVKIDYFDISSDNNTGLISEIFNKKRMELYRLDQIPLARFLFFKRNNGYHFYLLIHHIISDAWSIQILKRELFLCYEAIQKGDEPKLPILSRQLSDYTRDIIRAFNKKEEKFVRFWASRLNWLNDPVAITQSIQLRMGIEESSNASIRDSYLKILSSGENKSFTWNFAEGKLEKLVLAATRLNSSVNSIVYASFLFSIYAIFNKDKILLATPIADRTNAGDRSIVGCLVGSIYLSKQMLDGTTLENFIREVYFELLKSTRYLIYSHKYILTDGMDLRLSSDVFVNFSNRNQTQSIRASTAGNGFGTEDDLYYPLNCIVSEYSDAISFKWQYNCQVFSDAEIISLTHYQNGFLENVTGESETSISGLRSKLHEASKQNS
ncbi:condensation domain-containing protein [Pedobacter sp. GR22-10]|uniref:condensation domain-containing protein n=1 Tax=Pedobacter sp. GR22-10 TaxID=2994472 RepID=UPI002247AEDC|nr:condensation domain-containing protein [Pedobacter sp. GR22-10]MCX2431617.1 condensation domain-containing protein [Pedobacter sp. GR22-10]